MKATQVIADGPVATVGPGGHTTNTWYVYCADRNGQPTGTVYPFRTNFVHAAIMAKRMASDRRLDFTFNATPPPGTVAYHTWQHELRKLRRREHLRALLAPKRKP